MEGDPAFAPVAPPAPPVARANVFAVIAHVIMFGAFGWSLSTIDGWKVMFEDLGAELPIPTMVLLKLNDMFGAMGVPIWSLAILLLGVDIGVYWHLERRGRIQAAHNWMWIVAGLIIPAAVVLQQLIMLPLVTLINSMK